MQPEAAVISAVSPWIEDQINLIHHVVDLLGEGWDILVKDHPAQAADPLFRSDLWVGSLSANPAITVLPPDVPSSDLLGSIDLAATIMGTIGWEAVRLGIPALVFGPAWYRQAPGVIEFREVSRHPCFDDALREAVARLQDPDALPRWLRQVSARLGVGYVGHLDTWRFEDDLRQLHTGSVDRESELRSNPRVVAESFLKIIDHELLTESARHSVR